MQPDEEQCLAELKEQVQKDYPDKHYADHTLLQFLVARNLSVKDAKKQLDETIEWRQTNAVDDIPCANRENGLPALIAIRGFPEVIDDQNVQARPGLSRSVINIINCMGGDCLHKTDKQGHPVLIDRTGYHNVRLLCKQVTSEEVTHYQVACNEFLNRVLMPVCAERVKHPVYRETVIFDCENLGMKQFQMSALQYLKVVADIIQHYYPETLNKLFVVNAPHAFVTIWHVIRRWLEPRTIEKVCIVSKHATAATLLEDIDAENLPDFLGGTCTCSHVEGGCVPSVALGTIPRLEAGEENEKVSTVYNTSIMIGKEVDDRT